MKLRTRTVGAAVTSLALALAVTGCGADESDEMSSAPPTGSNFPSQDPGPVVEIDDVLLTTFLSRLEGREPPGGWSGVPGTDMQWCMHELGWQVEAHPDGGGVSYEGIAEQAGAMDTAFVACQETMHYDVDDYLTPDFLTVDYDDRVRVAQCLRDEGYEVGDPPSREAFTDQSIRERLVLWDPLAEVPVGQLDAARASCPATPPWELKNELDGQGG